MEAAEIAAFDHEFPVPLARAVLAAPPIGVRSTVTVLRLLLGSVAVHVRVEVGVVPPAGTLVGENEQAPTTGSRLGVTEVIVTEPVDEAPRESMTVITTEVAPTAVPVAITVEAVQ